jgi:hypothetical protein
MWKDGRQDPRYSIGGSNARIIMGPIRERVPASVATRAHTSFYVTNSEINGRPLMRPRFIFMGYQRARLALLIYATVAFVFSPWLCFLLILCVPRRSNRKQRWLSRRGHSRSFVAVDSNRIAKPRQSASPNAPLDLGDLIGDVVASKRPTLPVRDSQRSIEQQSAPSSRVSRDRRHSAQLRRSCPCFGARTLTPGGFS